jgi:hypothetical protein
MQISKALRWIQDNSSREPASKRGYLCIVTRERVNPFNWYPPKSVDMNKILPVNLVGWTDSPTTDKQQPTTQQGVK